MSLFISKGHLVGNLMSRLIYEPAHEILVHIALSSNEGSGKPAQMRRLTKDFAAHIHKVWMLIKTQIKMLTSSPAGSISMGD